MFYNTSQFQSKHLRLSNLRIFLLLAAVFISQTSAATSLTITASVDRTALALNQQLTLSVDISGEGANKVGPPDLPDVSEFLAFLSSGGTSQSINFINGRMTVQKGYTYHYMAIKEGSFEIGPVSVVYEGKTYSSKPTRITISKSAPQAQGGQPQARSAPRSNQSQVATKGELFVKGLVNKRKVYQNEPIVLTFRIYTNVNVTNFGISKLPGTSGFWVEDVPMPNQPKVRNEVINGIKYSTADVKKMILFPTSPGKKTIEPLGLECDVRVQSRSRRDFFDHFFDDPFFGRSVRKSIYSQPITIEALPLPEANKPANFSGAVGRFKLTASVDKKAIKTNEAITLKVKISGQGNIKILPEPKVDIPSDFERYDAKVSENIDRNNNVLSGSKTYEYVLVPRFPGTQKISPIQFAYFDVGAKDYKILRTPEIVVDVAKGEEEFATSGVRFGKEEVRYTGQDIRFIKKTTSAFRQIGQRAYQSTLYLALLVFPLIVLAGSWGYRSYQDKLSENLAYARSRRANQMAMSRLRKAKGLLSEDSQKEYYAEIARALQGFVGNKLNISEAGIITDEIAEKLSDKGADDASISELIDCLQHCDFQRFAPAATKPEEMKAFFEKAKNVIIALEKAI